MTTFAPVDLIREIESDPIRWKLALFEPYLTDSAGRIVPDADHHAEFWLWLWAIERGVRPDPFIGIWPRGGAKSTNVELGVVALAARRRRRYALYVSGTQDRADDHVSTVGGMLESRLVASFYPDLAERRVGKYGNSRGWRRNRLRTSSGFTIDALGLDVAARGVKIDEQRPDLIVLDDVDGNLDTPATTDKRIRAITETLLPAGSDDLAVIGIQNLVHRESIFSRLAGVASTPADFLATRIVSGPIPAVANLDLRQVEGAWRIVAGEPTWIGLDIGRAQAMIDDMGATAFLRECQHDVSDPPGGMFDHLDFAALTVDNVSLDELRRVVVWVDPAVTSNDDSDSQAIQADGIDDDGRIVRLFSWEQRTTPREALRKAILIAAELGATYVGIETDQGGDTWEDVFRNARSDLLDNPTTPGELLDKIRRVQMKSAKAGQGYGSKVERASRMLADYERPGRRIVHAAGTHRILEAALSRFPKTKPFDLTDASFWSWNDLRNTPQLAGYDPNLDPEVDLRALRQAESDAYTARRPGGLFQ